MVRRVASLLVAAAVTNVAYTILIPFVPFLAEELEMSSFAIGAAFGGFALTKALFQPLGGFLSDRVGAPTVAVAGLLATAVATVGLSMATNGDQVIAWRLIWGVAEGLMVPALYQLCFSIRPADRDFGGKMMGWFGSAAVLGMAAGPAVVGLLHDEAAFGRFFQITAAVTVLAALLVLLNLRHSTATPGSEPENVEHGRVAAYSFLVVVVVLGAADFLNNFLFGALEPTLPLHIDEALGGGTEAISVIFTAGLLVFAVVSAPAGFVIARLGIRATIAMAFAVAVIGFAVQAAASAVPALAVGFLLFMATQPLVYVAVRRGIAAVQAEKQGRAFGLLGFVSDLGYVLGPVVGTVLFDLSSAAMFAALGAACLLAAAVAFWAQALLRLSERRAAAHGEATDHRVKGALS